MMQNKNIVIAIDGVVASGKWTLAQWIAKRLGYRYIDTWAMYRAVSLYLLREGVDHTDTVAVEEVLGDIHLWFTYNPKTERSDVLLNEENVEREIRTPEVQDIVSPVSTIVAVRKKLVAAQQVLAAEWGIVLDGRDIGTVVAPDAELKIFLTADEEERAQRRLLQMKARWIEVDLQDQIASNKDRDTRDYFGPGATSKISPDAKLLDTTHSTIEEELDIIAGRVQQLV